MVEHDGTHYSGVLVLTRREELSAAAAGVGAIPDVEVYLRDEGAGRLIAVLESRDTQGQEDLLRRIRAVPGVLTAALVYHHIDREAASGAAEGGRP